MKHITFLTIFIPTLLLANVAPEIVINELYVPENDMWRLELRSGYLEDLDSLYIVTKSDTAPFRTGLDFNSEGFIVVDSSSIQNSLNIDKSGDSISIWYWMSYAVAGIYFGPGEKYKAPDSNQSLCRDQYMYADYYLDNSPTLGAENDSLGASCSIQAYVRDTWRNPIDSVKLRLNGYWTGAPWPSYRDSTYTNTEGFFLFRPLAYAFPSNIQFKKYGYDVKKIENLNLRPGRHIYLGTVILTGGSSVPEDEISINRFTLSQNYPNPVIGETKIVFTLPEQLPTLLEVYNSEGRKVKTLVKGTISRGKYEVSLDAGELSSGVYIYKLRAGRHYSDSKKLIITK